MPTFGLDQKKVAFVGSTETIANTIHHYCEKAGFNFLEVEIDPKKQIAKNYLSEFNVIFIELSKPEDLQKFDVVARMRSDEARVVAVGEVTDLAQLRYLIRRGLSDLLPFDLVETEVEEACFPVYDRAMLTGARNIFAFTPVLGGMGATTLAIETALYFNSIKKGATCVVDLDFYAGECSDYLNVDSKLPLDVLADRPETIDDHLLEGVLSEHSSGLKLLAAQTQLGAQKHINAVSVLKLLNLISSRFMNVIIDLPRSWFEWTDDVILGCDRLFLVSDSSVPAMRAAKRQLDEYRNRYVGRVTPSVIINKHDKSWFSSGLSSSELQKALGTNYGGIVGDETKLAREAIDRGLPISMVKKKASLVLDIKNIISKYAK